MKTVITINRMDFNSRRYRIFTIQGRAQLKVPIQNKGSITFRLELPQGIFH